MWLKWVFWTAGAIVGGYVAIVVLFALYFALASYLPLLVRRLRRSASHPGRPAMTAEPPESPAAPGRRGARAGRGEKPEEA